MIELQTTWNLRTIMASKGLFQTTDLRPLLAERGVELSREQVYRLVTTPPRRISLDVLSALCDALECSKDELILTERRERSEERRVGKEWRDGGWAEDGKRKVQV